ncbi:MAG TPA: ArsA-related P-loop ATPase [Myxococcales bacterium]|nr:ArsA-related P-loop ATPase [Myxococcales bacterium]
MPALPRILFVMGKGGTGRSSVAAAFGSAFAARGESTLVVEWSFLEAIAPWFGLPPAGHAAREILPGLSVMNYSLDETLREYFVDHLGVRLLHDHVITNRHVQRLIHATPGVAELLFCGRLFWLTSLAKEETGHEWQRIVVDAPATGHGAPLLAIPRTLAGFDLTGLLSLERYRVTRMFANPQWTGVAVVTLAEELAMEETTELRDRVQRELGRPPVALVVNRCVSRFLPDGSEPAWHGPALRSIYRELLARRHRERELCADPIALALDEALMLPGDGSPRAVVESMAGTLRGLL